MGEHTVIDNSIYPPKIQKLHINVEDWMGDNIMEKFPVYIITERLKKGLQTTDFKGFKINNLELTTDEYFFEHYQLKKEIPKFYWLLVIGKKNKDDLYIDDQNILNISEKLFLFLKRYNLNYCSIVDENKEDEEIDYIYKEYEKLKNSRNSK